MGPGGIPLHHLMERAQGSRSTMGGRCQVKLIAITTFKVGLQGRICFKQVNEQYFSFTGGLLYCTLYAKCRQAILKYGRHTVDK